MKLNIFYFALMLTVLGQMNCMQETKVMPMPMSIEKAQTALQQIETKAKGFGAWVKDHWKTILVATIVLVTIAKKLLKAKKEKMGKMGTESESENEIPPVLNELMQRLNKVGQEVSMQQMGQEVPMQQK